MRCQGDMEDVMMGTQSSQSMIVPMLDVVPCDLLLRPLSPESRASQTLTGLSYITLDQRGCWEAALDLRRHEEILGTGARQVDARGGDGTNAPVCGDARGGGIISELFQSCGLRLDAPAGTQECHLLANNVISGARWHGSFLPPPPHFPS